VAGQQYVTFDIAHDIGVAGATGDLVAYTEAVPESIVVRELEWRRTITLSVPF
jgi:hypothetical protein